MKFSLYLLTRHEYFITTKKKIIPMIIGDIIFPKITPNLNHNLFSGVKIFERITICSGFWKIAHFPNSITL